MILLRTTGLYLRRLWLRPRAFLVLPVLFFVAYRSVNGVTALAGMYGQAANFWDALFYGLSAADTVYLALSLLVLYLLGDLSAETRYGQALMLRLGTRRRWWAAKLLTLAVSCMLFTLLTALVPGIWTAANLPVEAGWSPMLKAGHTIEIGLPYDALDLSPAVLLLRHLVLLFLGWTSLGLLGMVAGLLIRRRWAAPTASLAALLSGYIGNTVTRQPVVFPWHLLVSYHLEYTPGWLPLRMLPFEFSLAYWLAWIVLLGAIGALLARRLDDPGVRIG